jgi:hypothetical protein
MATKVMSADDKRWQAESDARTMAQYEEIMQDSARRRAAVAEAKKQASDLNKRAAVMNKVAGNKSNNKPSKRK